MKIVLTELEMKEAIADYMAKQASSVEIIKMDPDEVPVTPLGLELGKNTMEAPFKPEIKYDTPAPVKRTRGPNKKTNAPAFELTEAPTPVTAPKTQPTSVDTLPVQEEELPFELDETSVADPVDELELETVGEETADTVNLFS